MTYTPTTWVDEVLASAERYDIKTDGGIPIESNVQLILVSTVTQAGTSVEAAALNNIEDGLVDHDSRLDDLEALPASPSAATYTEINTGTEAAKYVSPDALAASIMGRKYMTIKVCDDATIVITGDGRIVVPIQPDFSGMNLISAHAALSTVSSSGLPNITIGRIRTGTGAGTVDMLSTAITIDATEATSLTAAAAPVINATYDDVLMNATSQDQLSINVDGAGTGAKGLAIMLAFGLP